MNQFNFEKLLSHAVKILTGDLRSNNQYHDPDRFEQRVKSVLEDLASDYDLAGRPTFHPSSFPDFLVNGYGVEVKYTKNDIWQAVGNSIFEGMRDRDAKRVYIVLGKTGGTPEVRWRQYEKCITQVRVSNSPRFGVDLGDEQTPLFDQIGVSYDDFAKINSERKMQYVRKHYRQRLDPGGRLWWLDPAHTLPVDVKIYRTLSDVRKRILRGEATLLCPEAVKPKSARGKYDNAGLYLIMQHGVFAPQLRDLFTAGSVGAKKGKRGHKHIIEAIRDIEHEMRAASENLDDRLIEEYWGFSCKGAEKRISEWLRLADKYATDWTPSEELFRADASK